MLISKLIIYFVGSMANFVKCPNWKKIVTFHARVRFGEFLQCKWLQIYWLLCWYDHFFILFCHLFKMTFLPWLIMRLQFTPPSPIEHNFHFISDVERIAWQFDINHGLVCAIVDPVTSKILRQSYRIVVYLHLNLADCCWASIFKLDFSWTSWSQILLRVM